MELRFRLKLTVTKRDMLRERADLALAQQR